MFSPQEIVDNYKNGIDFTENQRSELSESESDAAEGDKNDIVSGENRNSESDSAEDEIAVNSSGSDSGSVHSEFRSSLKATSESESDTESKSKTSSSKTVKDKNQVETDLTDEDEDQFEEETQKEQEVIRLNTYTNSKLIRAKSMVQSVQFDEEKKYFTVNDSKKWYIVTLYPPHCYCIDSPNCCHILATKIKQGLIIDPEYVKSTKISTLMSKRDTKSKSSGSGLKRSQRMKKNKVDLDSISTSNDINYLMQLIVCDDIHEMITNSKLVNEKYIETDANALTRIFLIENIDFLEKYFDNDAWIAVKSLVKLYKDKFVCKLCSEPAEKDSIKCKTCHYIFHFKCKDVSAHYQKTYECGRWKCGCT